MTIATPPPARHDATERPTSATNPNRLLLLGALAGAAAVLLLVLAVLIGYWLGRSSQPSVDTAATQPADTAATRAESTFLPPVITEPLAEPVTAANTDPLSTDPLSSDPLVTASLPADPALAAEEVDRHSDEQQRLANQKQTLNQQVGDSNQLIELKAEQIRLLEAELAKQP